MSILNTVVLIVVDIVIVAGISIGIGALAPRWSGQWLTRDIGVLRFAPWESRKFFRFFRTESLAKRLPELGDTFGGESKSQAPGRDIESIDRYLVELRRAEWVHWVSIVSWVPLAFFNPWWLTVAFAVIVITGNTLFLLILRGNRLRLSLIRDRLDPTVP